MVVCRRSSPGMTPGWICWKSVSPCHRTRSMRTPGCPKCHKRDWRCEALSGAGISCCPRFWNSRISDQQFQAGQFPASCKAPQSTCRKDSLPLRRLESTTIVVGSVSPLRSSISNSGATCGEGLLSPVRSMLSGSQRIAARAFRRGTLGTGRSGFSLALHLTLLLSLLIIPPTQPPTSAAEPLTVDVITGEGPAAATSEPPAPTEAPAALDCSGRTGRAAAAPRFSKLRYRHQRRHPRQCLFRRHPSRWRRCTRRGRRHSVPPPAPRSTRRGRLRARAGRAECRGRREQLCAQWRGLDREAEAVVGPALLLSHGGVADQ